ncbi:hypothetical protein GH714_021133 [Hevea brasiliensis]|uniref:Uncharacterized protein n=1 Tax=Hevea brasiliensis TaxID=3981 RepID=A0A6A6MC66_HEVBR|nr:hypothetical protein GH714_021133 [Hevea brasiliensis]
MENIGEAVDDQDSGWFEVKKKHRSSAKLTQSSLGEKSGNLHGQSGSQLPKTGANLSIRGHDDVDNYASVSNKGGNGVICTDKSVGKQDNEYGKLSDLFVTNSNAKAGDT